MLLVEILEKLPPRSRGLWDKVIEHLEKHGYFGSMHACGSEYSCTALRQQSSYQDG